MTEKNTPTAPVSYRMPAGPGSETETIVAAPTLAFHDLAATIPACAPGCRDVARVLGPGYELAAGFGGRVCPLQAAVYDVLQDGEKHDQQLQRAEICDTQGLPGRAADLRRDAAELRAWAERLAARAAGFRCRALVAGALQQPAPPDLPVLRTHQLEWDPPGPSAANRWTCTACGRAAIDNHGNVYGTATANPCTAASG
ncbi:hypothetical protein ACPC54_18265 [Kitasatospora sp. NPDC094028]